MEYFVCNKKDCLKEITSVGFVTICSHIFCESHGRSLKRICNVGRCAACSFQFKDESNIIEVNVNPSSTLKSLMLSGLGPQAILEIAGNAISFWNYQKTQENEILKKRLENYREKVQSFQTITQRTREDHDKVVRNLLIKLEQVTAQNQQLKMQVLEKSNRISELEMKNYPTNNRSPSLF